MSQELTVKELHDLRLGPDAHCKNCMHAYPFKATLKDSMLVCMRDPPAPAYATMMDRDGVIREIRQSNHLVMRPVPEDHFCGGFVLAKDKVQ